MQQEGHPCCYISRTLNPAKRNYTTTEKELLTIVWAVKGLRQYLLGRKFTTLTDHSTLTCLFNVKLNRLLRWRLKLEEYQYQIIYMKSKQNIAADALSRRIYLLQPIPSTSRVVTDELIQM